MNEINNLLRQLLVSSVCGWLATCGLKWQHDTEEQAWEHARLLNERLGRHPQEPYPCGWCFQWHVGGRFKQSRMRYLVNKALSFSAARIERGDWEHETWYAQAPQDDPGGTGDPA